MLTALAVFIAFVVAWTAVPAISAMAPMVTLDVTMNSLLRVAAIAFAVAIVAALVPAYLVARVDPAAALKV
jgi:ABC-type antimicrobial peptide transport system permease subunit